MTGHRLIDRVVDDLVDEVMEASNAGGADVHAGPLADRLEAFEDLDVLGVVVRGLGAAGLRWCLGWCLRYGGQTSSDRGRAELRTVSLGACAGRPGTTPLCYPSGGHMTVTEVTKSAG